MQENDPAAEHVKIEKLWPGYASTPYIAFTDGSGTIDDYGGASAIVARVNNWSGSGKAVFDDVRTICVAHSHTSVDRIEFTALLEALQSILEIHGKVQDMRPVVKWFTDRESLAMSVWKPDGMNSFYSRKNAPDLWARLAWYEQSFYIVPSFGRRNKDPNQKLTDLLSSEMRESVKMLCEVYKHDGVITNQIHEQETK